MEQHYVFLKDNRVLQIAVFASEDEDLAARIAAENGWDNAIWVGENRPPIYSTWDGNVFQPATEEYLVSIGALPPSVLEEQVVEN